MLTKFSEGLEGKLAEQWIATVLSPAFGFWAGGLLAIVYHKGWAELARWFGQQGQPLQIAMLVVALVGVAASAQVINRFDHTLIRVLEGYWPQWLNPVRSWLITRQTERYEKADQRFQELAMQLEVDSAAGSAPNSELYEQYCKLDWCLRRIPAMPEQRMPTRLGNRLRATERISIDKYGLDTIICWPRLWLLLPVETRNEVSAAREALDAAARLWLWGMLFFVWTIWAWWAVPVGIIVILLAYRWMLNAADVHGDIVEAAFDLHRFKLYEALRWPVPLNPAAEGEAGRALTKYLWRGSDEPTPEFKIPVKS